MLMAHLGQNLGRSNGRAWLVGALAVLCLASFAAVWWLRTPLPGPTSLPATVSNPGFDPAPEAATKPPADNARPSFDIVRVGPQGTAVIAGRSAPDSEIIVRDGSRELGHARADGNGQWVLTPDQPLAPGARELTLESRLATGAPTPGDASVLLVVPNRSAPASTPDPGALAVLVPSAQGTAPRLLQSPSAASRSGLGLDVIDYDEQGAIRFAGHAPAGAAVRLYIDNAPYGDATADAQGAWALLPHGEVPPGRHTVRVDQVGAAGQVLARAELPFEREPPAPSRSTSDETRLVVQPGQNLWRIAREAYGQGTRYTLIFAANRDHIRDPRLIYPGQAFAIPPATR